MCFPPSYQKKKLNFQQPLSYFGTAKTRQKTHTHTNTHTHTHTHTHTQTKSSEVTIATVISVPDPPLEKSAAKPNKTKQKFNPVGPCDSSFLDQRWEFGSSSLF